MGDIKKESYFMTTIFRKKWGIERIKINKQLHPLTISFNIDEFQRSLMSLGMVMVIVPYMHTWES